MVECFADKEFVFGSACLSQVMNSFLIDKPGGKGDKCIKTRRSGEAGVFCFSTGVGGGLTLFTTGVGGDHNSVSKNFDRCPCSGRMECLFFLALVT